MSAHYQPPLWCLIVSLLAICGDQDALAETKADANKRFVRLLQNSPGEPSALQTSVARYAGTFDGQPVVVDLVSAVHLGDKAYYQQLNKLFKHYDAVLYEFVAPAGLEVPDPDRPSAGPLTFLRESLQSLLSLDSQLEHVDYSPDNFVHADMSPREMSAALRARGDNMMSFMLSAIADAVRQSNIQMQELDESELETFDPFTLLTDDEAGHKLKLQMAKQFDRMGNTSLALGSTINQLLVEDRNQAAMRVLRKQLGKGDQRLAIFYGAAHMGDFERRLMADYGLKHVETEWLNAWKLEKLPAAQDSLTSMLLRALQGNW